IPHFSNPDVLYQGVPTGFDIGSDAEANNYLAFLATAPILANYRCSGDCNDNGIEDSIEIADGTAEDCDENGIPDTCQVDFDNDGIIDACESERVPIRVPEDTPSIHSAIALSESGAHEIIVGPGTWLGEVRTLSKSSVIRGSLGPEYTSIDAGSSLRAMRIFGSSTPETIVSDLTLTGGNVTGDGGGLLIDFANPTIRNCYFINNNASYAGGGLRITSGYPLIDDCQFNGNAALYGGGISSWSGLPVIRNCRFTGNTSISGGHGGGYSSWDSPAIFESCIFQDNICVTGTGGAIFTNSNPNYLIEVSDTRFCENEPDDINSSTWQDNGGNIFGTFCPDCLGDATGDFVVNVNDVLYLISAWNTADPNADFDGDGLVDADDVLILLIYFGEPCP
ncbi:MAG: GC-type dockerin domain-anchored protein, partial [Phycisphaerales bacterium]|nr:GC-type dockerin domain-anchored protein [Phycisphaerales bacterium]